MQDMITFDVKISVCINKREHIVTKLAVLGSASYSGGPTEILDVVLEN